MKMIENRILPLGDAFGSTVGGDEIALFFQMNIDINLRATVNPHEIDAAQFTLFRRLYTAIFTAKAHVFVLEKTRKNN